MLKRRRRDMERTVNAGRGSNLPLSRVLSKLLRQDLQGPITKSRRQGLCVEG